jgi:hypothetical protein
MRQLLLILAVVVLLECGMIGTPLVAQQVETTALPEPYIADLNRCTAKAKGMTAST